MRVYRASSLGYSLEQLVAPHLGYEPVAPPDFLQAAYDEGNRLEPIIIEHLRALGWDIYGEQTEVVIEVIPGEVSIVGHVDGFLHEPNDVLEIKTMAHAAFLDWERNGWNSKSPLIEKYKWQQSAYVIATGRDHVMVGWDKSSHGEYSSVVTVEPFYDLQTLADKVLAAEQAIREGVLPEGCTDFPCSFFYLHPNKEAVLTEQANEELESHLQRWLEYDKIEKTAKRAKDTLRTLIVGAQEDGVVAGKIKGACGVTVSTNWVEEKHVEYDVKAHWETRIQGPRNAK